MRQEFKLSLNPSTTAGAIKALVVDIWSTTLFQFDTWVIITKEYKTNAVNRRPSFTPDRTRIIYKAIKGVCHTNSAQCRTTLVILVLFCSSPALFLLQKVCGKWHVMTSVYESVFAVRQTHQEQTILTQHCLPLTRELSHGK